MTKTTIDLPLKRFAFVFVDKEGCDIPECGFEVTARDLGHALQKIAALHSDDAVEVKVWETSK